MNTKQMTNNLMESVKYVKSLGYKVSWKHHPSKDVATTTTCTIMKEGEEHVGTTQRNPKDSPNLKIARHISFQRAIRDINF